jgi:hypothetical protein
VACSLRIRRPFLLGRTPVAVAALRRFCTPGERQMLEAGRGRPSAVTPEQERSVIALALASPTFGPQRPLHPGRAPGGTAGTQADNEALLAYTHPGLPGPQDEEIQRLKVMVGDLTMRNELLREQARAHQADLPLASRRSRR